MLPQREERQMEVWCWAEWEGGGAEPTLIAVDCRALPLQHEWANSSSRSYFTALHRSTPRMFPFWELHWLTLLLLCLGDAQESGLSQLLLWSIIGSYSHSLSTEEQYLSGECLKKALTTAVIKLQGDLLSRLFSCLWFNLKEPFRPPLCHIMQPLHRLQSISRDRVPLKK